MASDPGEAGASGVKAMVDASPAVLTKMFPQVYHAQQHFFARYMHEPEGAEKLAERLLAVTFGAMNVQRPLVERAQREPGEYISGKEITSNRRKILKRVDGVLQTWEGDEDPEIQDADLERRNRLIAEMKRTIKWWLDSGEVREVQAQKIQAMLVALNEWLFSLANQLAEGEPADLEAQQAWGRKAPQLLDPERIEAQMQEQELHERQAEAVLELIADHQHRLRELATKLRRPKPKPKPPPKPAPVVQAGIDPAELANVKKQLEELLSKLAKKSTELDAAQKELAKKALALEQEQKAHEKTKAAAAGAEALAAQALAEKDAEIERLQKLLLDANERAARAEQELAKARGEGGSAAARAKARLQVMQDTMALEIEALEGAEADARADAAAAHEEAVRLTLEIDDLREEVARLQEMLQRAAEEREAERAAWEAERDGERAEAEAALLRQSTESEVLKYSMAEADVDAADVAAELAAAREQVRQLAAQKSEAENALAVALRDVGTSPPPSLIPALHDKSTSPVTLKRTPPPTPPPRAATPPQVAPPPVPGISDEELAAERQRTQLDLSLLSSEIGDADLERVRLAEANAARLAELERLRVALDEERRRAEELEEEMQGMVPKVIGQDASCQAAIEPPLPTFPEGRATVGLGLGPMGVSFEDGATLEESMRDGASKELVETMDRMQKMRTELSQAHDLAATHALAEDVALKRAHELATQLDEQREHNAVEARANSVAHAVLRGELEREEARVAAAAEAEAAMQAERETLEVLRVETNRLRNDAQRAAKAEVEARRQLEEAQLHSAALEDTLEAERKAAAAAAEAAAAEVRAAEAALVAAAAEAAAAVATLAAELGPLEEEGTSAVLRGRKVLAKASVLLQLKESQLDEMQARLTAAVHRGDVWLVELEQRRADGAVDARRRAEAEARVGLLQAELAAADGAAAADLRLAAEERRALEEAVRDAQGSVRVSLSRLRALEHENESLRLRAAAAVFASPHSSGAAHHHEYAAASAKAAVGASSASAPPDAADAAAAATAPPLALDEPSALEDGAALAATMSAWDGAPPRVQRAMWRAEVARADELSRELEQLRGREHLLAEMRGEVCAARSAAAADRATREAVERRFEDAEARVVAARGEVDALNAAAREQATAMQQLRSAAHIAQLAAERAKRAEVAARAAEALQHGGGAVASLDLMEAAFGSIGGASGGASGGGMAAAVSAASLTTTLASGTAGTAAAAAGGGVAAAATGGNREHGDEDEELGDAEALHVDVEAFKQVLLLEELGLSRLGAHGGGAAAAVGGASLLLAGMEAVASAAEDGFARMLQARLVAHEDLPLLQDLLLQLGKASAERADGYGALNRLEQAVVAVASDRAIRAQGGGGAVAAHADTPTDVAAAAAEAVMQHGPCVQWHGFHPWRRRAKELAAYVGSQDARKRAAQQASAARRLPSGGELPTLVVVSNTAAAAAAAAAATAPAAPTGRAVPPRAADLRVADLPLTPSAPSTPAPPPRRPSPRVSASPASPASRHALLTAAVAAHARDNDRPEPSPLCVSVREGAADAWCPKGWDGTVSSTSRDLSFAGVPPGRWLASGGEGSLQMPARLWPMRKELEHWRHDGSVPAMGLPKPRSRPASKATPRDRKASGRPG